MTIDMHTHLDDKFDGTARGAAAELDRQLAEALGLDEDTVARGRRELLAAEVQPDRVRRIGGGRPRAEKKRPPS